MLFFFIFPADQAIKYHLLLDNSKSMEPHKPELQKTVIKHIKSLTKSLKNQGRKVEISCCVFHSDKQIYETKPSKVMSLIKHIGKTESIGNTNIFDAILDNLEWLNMELKSPSSPFTSKSYFVLVTDGHQNASTRYNVEEVNNRILKLYSEYQLEFIMVSALFQKLNAEIKLVVPGWGQYTPNNPAFQEALEYLKRYIAGELTRVSP